MRTIRAVPVALGLLALALPARAEAQAREASAGAGDAGFWRWALADVRGGDRRSPTPWARVGMDGLRLGESDRPPRRDGRLGSSDLASILGGEALDRLLARAGADAARGFLNGRWQRRAGPPRARILQVRVVDRPLAEITDLDADGRADAVLVYRPGR